MRTTSNKIIAAGLTAATVMVAAMATTTPASAAGWRGHRYAYYHHYYRHPYYRHAYGWRHRRYYGYGPAPLFGAIVGSIASAALAPRYYYGPPAYYYGGGPYYGSYYGW